MRKTFRNAIGARVTALFALSSAVVAAPPTPSLALVAGDNLPASRVEAGDFARLGFDELAAFPFDPPPIDPTGKAVGRTGEEQIPAHIKRWSGRRVVITGYMVPIKSEQGFVTEFMLTRYTVAAGNVAPPTINEWVIVRLKNGVSPVTRLPVSCSGVFRVGAVFEKGYMIAIFELEAERVGEG